MLQISSINLPPQDLHILVPSPLKKVLQLLIEIP